MEYQNDGSPHRGAGLSVGHQAQAPIKFPDVRLHKPSDVGGHKEIVTDRQTGLLFRAGEKEALAETILYALENEDQVNQIKISARKYIEEERNWKDLVAQYKPVYETLAGSAHSNTE
jgi:glycosyltransferase involved in cell wall biosynthesis